MSDGLVRRGLHKTVNRAFPRYAIPQVFIHPALPVALLWSPKAGCTTVLKWALAHCGLLDDALVGRAWVHDYTQQSLFRSAAYFAAVAKANFSTMPVIKVTRHPADRLVSAFAHAFRMRMVSGIDQISFRMFVERLAETDLETCNPHFRKQTHPLERSRRIHDLRLIRLEEGLFEQLQEIERCFGLPQTDFEGDSSRFDSFHHTAKDHGSPWGPDTMFAIGKAAVLPDWTQFYDRALQETVRRLYSEDFDRYGYRTQWLE
jgi:hypothetical protein